MKGRILNMSSFNSSAYVETDALLGWKNEMSSLNLDAKEAITEVSTALSSLDDGWKGESANGFNLTMEEVFKTIVEKHDEMGKLEASLQLVVETMESH